MLSAIPLWVSIISKVLSASSDVFTITTKGCTIPGFPLISENIRTFIRLPQNINKCMKNNNRLVDSNSTHVWIIEESLYLFNVFNTQQLNCCYRGFASKGNIENIIYEDCIEFSTSLKARHVFVRVECYYFESKIYDDFFVFTDLENYGSMKLQDKRDHYNILILGIEGISRMNFHRTMPRTAEYLNLSGAIELRGYNKLGDNSFPNLFPLIFGNSFRYIKDTCFEGSKLDRHHDCKFIWDRFKEAGYYTGLGSDSLAGFLGEYEYNLKKPPTDFFLQPFMYESRHLFKNPYYHYHQCIGSKYAYRILLNYIEGLVSNLNHHRLFGIFWEQSISHDDLNYPHVMDMDYITFLFKLEDIGYLNNTVVIFLSDHGMRWGDIVHTEQGRLEERLPLLQFLFPNSFKTRHVQAYKNFKENSRLLTTPYDVYETLKDLANPASLSDSQINQRAKSDHNIKASSLFLPISDTRTCESVGIEEHWCSCYRGKKLKVTNIIRRKAAERLMYHINSLLRPYPECQQLSIKEILQVSMVQNDKNRIYTVVIETTPGGAVLDGTLIRQREYWTVSGTVSRHNLYQNDTCIDDDLTKMYCFCNN